MCILAMALGISPRWRLLLLANRDERHARPSAPLAPWADEPTLLGGRDEISGGAWLGVSTKGRLALVTNLGGYGDPNLAAPSRGALVADFLRGEATPSLAPYNPANLITLGDGAARFATNRPALAAQDLPPGLHGLSNRGLDEPTAKVVDLKRALASLLRDHDGDLEPLYAALRSEAAASAGSPSAGVFVRDPVYGTRCSTIVSVDAKGQGVIAERRFDAAGVATGESRLAFQWPTAATP